MLILLGDPSPHLMCGSLGQPEHRICKKRFYVFYFGHVFTFFKTFFLFSKRFSFFKNVGKVHSVKQINKKHFQNNSNDTDL